MNELDDSRAMRQSDHDLLITLHEQVKAIRTDIKDLADGTSIKIVDHELRIRRLEYALALVSGLSIAAQFYFNYLK